MAQVFLRFQSAYLFTCLCHGSLVIVQGLAHRMQVPHRMQVFRKKTFSVKYGPPEALNIIKILLNDIEEKTRHYLQSYYGKVVVTNQSYPKTNNQKSLFSFLSHE